MCVYIYIKRCVKGEAEWEPMTGYYEHGDPQALSLEKLESNTDKTGNSLSLSLSLSHTHTHTQKIEFHSSWFNKFYVVIHECYIYAGYACMKLTSLQIMFCCNRCKILFFWIYCVILPMGIIVYPGFIIHHLYLFIFLMIDESCMYVGYVWQTLLQNMFFF